MKELSITHQKSLQLLVYQLAICILLASRLSFCSISANRALYSAIQRSNIKLIQVLLDVGADPNFQKERYSQTLLQMAVNRNDTSIALLLLNAGADPHPQTKHCKSPLQMAANWNNTKIILALIKAGADCNHVDKYGSPPLYWANQGGHNKSVKTLLSIGAQIGNWFNTLPPAAQAIINQYRHLISERKQAIKEVCDKTANHCHLANHQGFPAVLQNLVEQFEGTAQLTQTTRHVRKNDCTHNQQTKEKRTRRISATLNPDYMP